MTTEAQLGLIGGTMGLLTGFSILSGVEIVYYLIRLFLSLRLRPFNAFFKLLVFLRIPRVDVVAATNNKFENHLMNKL